MARLWPLDRARYSSPAIGPASSAVHLLRSLRFIHDVQILPTTITIRHVGVEYNLLVSQVITVVKEFSLIVEEDVGDGGLDFELLGHDFTLVVTVSVGDA